MAKYTAFLNGIWQQVAGLVTSTGASDAGKLIETGSDGKIDPSLMPPGIAANQKIANANGGIAIRDLVYIESAGTIAKASAASGGKPAQGWALATVTTGQPVAMQTEGVITGLSGLTPGAEYFLSDATPGQLMISPGPASNLTGKFAQSLGYALSATELDWNPQKPVYLVP